MADFRMRIARATSLRERSRRLFFSRRAALAAQVPEVALDERLILANPLLHFIDELRLRLAGELAPGLAQELPPVPFGDLAALHPALARFGRGSTCHSCHGRGAATL